MSVGLYAPYTFFYAFKLVGLVIFLGYVAYAIDCLQAGIIYAATRAEPAFINALTMDMALGCSTNSMLHLPAIAHECGVELDLDFVNEISKRNAGRSAIPPVSR